MAKRMKLDPHCQRRNCCALKVLFNDVYRLRRHFGRSKVRGDLGSCVLYTKAVALAGLSCNRKWSRSG